jgi:type III restriction enzyme
MKLKFDPNQAFQLDAVAAVTGLFHGRRRWRAKDGRGSAGSSANGAAAINKRNVLGISDAKLLSNTQGVQRLNNLPVSESLDGKDFSVEMETGTGKTYVYLRTIHELHRQYGICKFVILVPSVAIREGVLQTFKATREHFDGLFGKVPVDFRVFSSKRLGAVRQYAVSSELQVLLLNIDALNKASNLIRRPLDELNGSSPLQVLADCCPVVILDEPQNFEGPQAKAALESLNSLCTLRYSATHRNAYNMVYRLSPVDAYDLGLVKRIEVMSVRAEGGAARGYMRLTAIAAGRKEPRAKVEIEVKVGGAVRRKSVNVTYSDGDLYEKSGHLEPYRDLRVSSIDADAQELMLSDGTRLTVELAIDKDRDAIMRAQIHETVREHLEKELALKRYFKKGPRVKVLSLLFIDRVKSYATEDGKFRRWFEESYTKLSADPRHSDLNLPKVSEVHRGYFSSTRAGRPVDTKGNTEADDDTYELIMQHKERLLSPEEPVRFVFSHSALREGWDNPNVFQICTLNETKSEIKKRQEIGRGLRLPVSEKGERVFDRAVNLLTVIANESYEEFARKLQTEIAEDCGIDFGGRVQNRRLRKQLLPKAGWERDPQFVRLWQAISAESTFSTKLDPKELVKAAAAALKAAPKISRGKVKATKAALELGKEGVVANVRAIRDYELGDQEAALPNPVDALQELTGLSRSTLVEVLINSGRLADFCTDPDAFIELAARAIEDAAFTCMVRGVSYKKSRGKFISVDGFKNRTPEVYENRLLPVRKSIFSEIEFESEVERKFAATLDARDDIGMLLKLPRWFLVPTPLGDYIPDWAIVKTQKSKIELHLVRETKSSWESMKLRGHEQAKIQCASKHFAALGVDFSVATDAAEI